MEATKSISASTWRKEVKCPQCQSHLKISWKDIFIQTTREKTFFSNKRILNYFITCSECNCKIKLDESKLPYVIKKKVYDNMDTFERAINFYFS